MHFYSSGLSVTLVSHMPSPDTVQDIEICSTPDDKGMFLLGPNFSIPNLGFHSQRVR